MEESVAAVADKNTPVGVGGWLAFFLVTMMVVSPLKDLTSFGDHLEDVSAVAWLFFVALHGLGWYAGILMLQGKAKGVRWARIRLIVGMCIGVLGGVLIIAAASDPPTTASGVKALFGSIIYSALWLAYLGESKRVKNTYFALAQSEPAKETNGTVPAEKQ